MKITIESTKQVIDTGGGEKVRVWEGHTESGTAVQVFVVRVAVAKDAPADVLARFESELAEQREPSLWWPARMIF
jgi:hypothetical protein